MSTAVSTEARIRDINVSDDTITARLVDGRVISVPLAWSWRLSEASPSQRQHYEIIGDGQGVHWPDVDEDISVEGMLHGTPAHPPSRLSDRPSADRGKRANKALQPTSRSARQRKTKRAKTARG